VRLRNGGFAMTLRTLALIVFLVLIVSGGVSSADQLSQRQLLDKFANDYVAAIQSGDHARVMALFHPGDRACVNAKSRAYFDYIVTQQMSGFPKGKYDKVSVTPISPKMKPIIWTFVPEKDFPYPVMPTDKVQIDYTTSNNLFTDLLETAPSGGSYYWVTACPTAAGLQFVRTAQEQGAEQQARYKKLAAAVRDPLLSKLKAMLASQDKIGAIDAYRKAAGVDTTTAVNVIDIIEGPK
jgi:hypothetical protein